MISSRVPWRQSAPLPSCSCIRTQSILIDEAAASSLKLADYYRHSYDHKPAWQDL